MKKIFLLLFFISCSVFYSIAQNRHVYKLAKEVHETIEVSKILNTAPLERVTQLKKLLPQLKNDLLDELKAFIVDMEKKVARKEIERSVWMNGIIDYVTLSYNLELLLYACELRISSGK